MARARESWGLIAERRLVAPSSPPLGARCVRKRACAWVCAHASSRRVVGAARPGQGGVGAADKKAGRAHGDALYYNDDDNDDDYYHCNCSQESEPGLLGYGNGGAVRSP